MKFGFRLGSLAAMALAFCFGARSADADDTIKFGYTELLSGTFAQVGDQGIKTIQTVIDGINAKGGVLGKKIVLVPMDNKGQPAEAILNMQKMVDEGIPIMLNCGPSNVASALIGAVDKNNARNKDHRILFVNCGGLAPELTNEQCNFWHFRFSMHAGQQAEIMVRAIPKSIKKVYVLNQDYIFGQSAQRDTKKYLAQIRPDIQIVGEEMIPLGKVKDFAPYISKVKASGAEALVTGNWGPDLYLLVRAGLDAGLPIEYYTFLGHLAGSPTAIGPAGNNRLHSVVSSHDNLGIELKNPELTAFIDNFRKKFDFDFIFGDRRMAVEMTVAAIAKAGSTDPMKVAQALEGITVTDAMGQPATMRKEDHQILLTYYGVVFTKDVKNDSEHTGLGWKTTATVKPTDLDQTHHCKMKRPAS
ncbi:MAG: branched-chain amino acid ABC transporter substrate-binding protein [Acetobacteraceae bacterium]